jgi:hypothetical protein
MADNIVDITFSSVFFQDAGHFGAVEGTIEVEYTTGTVTNSALVATVDGNVYDFTSPTATFTLTPAGSLFSVAGIDGANAIDFVYSGEQPTSLEQVGLVLPGPGLALSAPPGTFTANFLSSAPLPCFVEGALIRTPRGDVSVETLKVGDLVVTSSRALRPVKWLGRRKMNCRTHPNPRSVFPIRIAIDAFGPNRPSQDLFLSSGHSACVDLIGEVLVPVGNLVNGATIVEVEVDTISYWHVELDSHDILIANNLPAESYLAMGNRGAFEELRGFLPAKLEGRERTHADFCRPVVTEGPVLDFIRNRLQTRAEAIGWTRSFETDLHLVIDSEVRRPLCEGDVAVFLFPASAREVRLNSNTFIPDLLGGGDPGRSACR